MWLLSVPSATFVVVVNLPALDFENQQSGLWYGRLRSPLHPREASLFRFCHSDQLEATDSYDRQRTHQEAG